MNASRFAFGRSFRVAAVGGLATLTFLVPALAAQDDDAPHPAHIHSGTCAELGDVVVPLTDVAAAGADVARSGPKTAIPVKTSETEVDMPLQDIIDGGHAINVHLSADDIGTYIACGDIGGAVIENADGRTSLTIGLGELNESGHTGVAWLGADGDVTEVSVELIEPGETSAVSTDVAQEAAPAGAEAESVAIEIKEFAYNPPTIEIPVGGTITWTNQDNVPHTATGLDREALQSGTLAFDQAFTQTFDTAGTIEYFCEFHPNMKGSIVVE